MLINERRDRGSGFRMKTLTVVMTATILAAGGAVDAESDSLSTLETRIDQIETTIGDLKRELKTLQTNIKEKETAETDAKNAEADAKKDLDSVNTRLGLAQELQTLSNGSAARIERMFENVLQKRVEAAEGKLEAAEWKLKDAKLERDAKRGKFFEAK